MKHLRTAGLIVINNRKLLLAFSKHKKAWYLPGGKIDKGETNLIALIREIREELNILLVQEDLKFYVHISAPAFGERPGVMMEQDCFAYVMVGTPEPKTEIQDLQYFDTGSYQFETKVPGVILLMQKLKDENLID